MSDPVDKLRADGAAEATIEAFTSQLERLRTGETGLLAETDIEPVEGLPDAEDLEDSPYAEDVDRAVVIKLNGGLGTSMGLAGPKSLLEVKDGLSFLDITARQIDFNRRMEGSPFPLVLMNSFATRGPSMAAFDLDDVTDFVQSRVPKLDARTLEAVEWPADPELEWAPPGHGDLYAALIGSGTLERLRRHYRWAFVSNADNLGAVFNHRILAWIAREEIPFCMEVADRTLADRKGGHLARRRGGAFVLREVAQTPEDDLEAFQDVTRHRFFNTNTLWIDLHALAGVPELPMIVNRKTVDPKDPSSPEVVQLETAMGAAIDTFDGARAIRVPRTRFAPVKTTNDLLALRSDAYVLARDGEVVLAPERSGQPPVVDLDPPYFKRVDDFDARFAHGAPSLVGCERLTVEGDVRFGAGVVVRGSVTVSEDVPDGAVLEG